ncbi:RHS repeat-associated core domain-containing protein, partial [Phenylobacterium sp.]|uniref:RHS repeat domain-containing protein n=1 Tax=Phenylobacterium sp. TaxID=1871053 RepID=UPI0025F057B0
TPTSAVDTIASGVSYRPFGPLESLTYGNGLTLTRTFDQNYWLGRVEVKATAVTRLDLSFARNENGQLAGVTDNASSGRGATFTYTDAGRLASAQGAWGGDSYTYDAAGGRLDKARQIGATTTHETAVDASTSNRVDSVQDGASATLRTLTWRTGGDLAQSVYAGGPTYDYQYNARKRLSLVNLNSVTRAQYGYDFRGQRVWADVSASMAHHSHFIFDSNGHLLAEHDAATGNPVREYLWVDDLLVAVIDSSTGTASTYFVHPGQLDEPLIMTDASRAMVWNAYVEPYGLATMLSMPSVGLPLRLPGQWEEIEDGDLSQNWRRNYDPSLGRYIEADPLGIEAGQSVYAYVDGDPLNNSDPWGLGPAGSLLGAEIGAWTAGVVGIETGPGEAGVIPAGALLGRSIGNALEDSISIAENNKQTRRKIAGLERQIEDHKRKLQKDPNCREANHWRGEIRAWTMRIKRLRGRLPNGK